MAPSWHNEEEEFWTPPQQEDWYNDKASPTSGNDLAQKVVLSGYDITSQDLAELVQELTDYLMQEELYDKITTLPSQSNELKKLRQPTIKGWLKATSCPRLRDPGIPARFHEAAAGTMWKMMLTKGRSYGKVKGEEGTRSPAEDTSRSARSPSVASTRSTTTVTNMMGLATVTEKMQLGDVNVNIKDSVTGSIARSFPIRMCIPLQTRTALEENDGEVKAHHLRYDAMIEYLSREKFREWYVPGKTVLFDPISSQKIEDDDDLFTTVNSHIMAKRLEGLVIEPRIEQAASSQRKAVTFGGEADPPLNVQPAEPRRRLAKRGRTIRDSDDSEEERRISRPRRGSPQTSIAAAPSRPNKRKPEGQGSRLRTRINNSVSVGRGGDDRRAGLRDRGKQGRRRETTEDREEEEVEEDEEEDEEDDEGGEKSGEELAPEHIENDEEEEEEQTSEQAAKEEERRRQAMMNAKTADALHNQAAKELEHCSPEEWQEAADFWGLPIEALKDDNPIRLPESWGLKTKFTRYQLTEAFILYKKERSTDNGGLFNNMMGMGKTRAFLLMVLLGHVHLHNYLEVYTDQANDDGTRHRRKDDPPGQCPTASERTFHCACEEHPSMPEEPRFAPTLASGWGRAPKAWKDETAYMELKDSKWCDSDDPLALRFCFMDDDPPLGMGPPTEDEVVEMRIAPDWEKLLARHNKSVLPREYTRHGQKQYETVYWEIPKNNMPRVHPDATTMRPAKSAGRFIFVCGHSTLQNRVINKYHGMDITIVRMITEKGVQSKKETKLTIPMSGARGNAMIWGRIIFDEFHNCKSENTVMGRLYESLRLNNHSYQWKAWAISGTPMEKGLHEILVFISLALIGLADSHGISNWDEKVGPPDKDGMQKYGTVDKVYKSINGKPPQGTRTKAITNGMFMAKGWAKIIGKGGGTDAITNSKEFKELMSAGVKIASRFMLRRTLTTRDPWGNAISSIKAKFLTLFRPCRNTSFKSTVAKAVQRCQTVLAHENELDVTDSAAVFSRAEMQAVASYPGLATLKASSYEGVGSAKSLRLVGDSITDQFTDLEKGWVAKNLAVITKDSTKLEAIEQQCTATMGFKVPDRQSPGKFVPAKILIGSVRPVVQLVTYLALREKFGINDVTLLRGGMAKSAMEVGLSSWRKPDGPRILVASLGAFAEAITLTEANTVIIVEPQDRQNIQEQFLFRVYRLGQLADICQGLVLYTPDSELELKVLSKQLLKTGSRDGLQGGSEIQTVQGETVNWDTDKDIPLKLEGIA